MNEWDNEIDRVARELVAGEPPADLKARVLARIEERRQPRRSWWWMAVPVAAAASLVWIVSVERGAPARVQSTATARVSPPTVSPTVSPAAAPVQPSPVEAAPRASGHLASSRPAAATGVIDMAPDPLAVTPLTVPSLKGAEPLSIEPLGVPSIEIAPLAADERKQL